jgi:4-aminobutyrate aminotransferase-like enzyme/Ser/Thr protein kinase RdoA (MazF antagonist)
MIETQRRPELSDDDAARRVREGWGLEGTLRPLPGERDRNWLLDAGVRGRFVVKVTSPDEPEALLGFETRLLEALEGAGPPATPGLVPARDGTSMRTVRDAGESWRIRLLTFLEGRTLAAIRPRTGRHLRALGRAVAALSFRLADHPENAPERPGFVWSLVEAESVIRSGLDLHADPGRRALMAACLDAVTQRRAALDGLPTQLIHGDLNDHNVLFGRDGEGSPLVTGVLDFGDAHAAPALFDLAIAAAYGILDATDPVLAAAEVVGGYHERRALSEVELDLLFPLVRARLAASVTISASRRRRGPLDDYLLVSERPGWDALRALDAVHPRVARGALRHACGYPACPRSASVVTWLRAQERIEPIMELPADATTVLDLSVGSPTLNGHDTDDTEAFARRVVDVMDRVGARVGLGRWLEPRGFYLTEAFEGRPSDLPERRTVHLGIDVFTRAGAEVRSPLPARVRSVKDNADRLDYGPTVILEHDSPDGPFWTLYGHLQRASVADLASGLSLAAGERFARVGPPPENGDWPPHLHLQIVTDLLDGDGNVPGVAAPREVDVWASFAPDPDLLLRTALPTTWSPPGDLLERRRRLLGPNLSLAYERPLHVVRGLGTHLYDEWGRAYLDCVNNVAHVGHENPRVVAAGQSQMAVLNTNTRYLHEAVITYAERLAALLPDSLSTCFFVNSGSEANELALRMARTATGRRGVVVLEGGYHGNTQALIDVSHYKHAHQGGAGSPPWVRVAAMPDDYRGRFRRDDPERARRYADDVGRAAEELERTGSPAAAFLAEAILSCGGQIVPPEGYLTAAYARARASGALCIADEVQVGLGRVGTHMWGFEAQGVEPDIVTLGKPIGNGHPIGVVITTRAIAEAFANGMEFFSTFGGNPVSASIGLAVLDVVRDAALQERALTIGDALLEGLRELAQRHPCVGDVRGQGLFLGVEMVADRDADDPVPDAPGARYVVNRARALGVLLSTDGPDDNVLKVKPPLTFSEGDAERLVTVLDRIFGEDSVRDPSARD